LIIERRKKGLWKRRKFITIERNRRGKRDRRSQDETMERNNSRLEINKEGGD
jgi:hypothetical protein